MASLIRGPEVGREEGSPLPVAVAQRSARNDSRPGNRHPSALGSRGLLVSSALLALALAGCATAPAKFYTLDSTATADLGPPLRDGVQVGPVTVPASVDRPEFVLLVAPNQVDINEFNLWAAPLGDSIARTVAGDLVLLLGTPDVAAGGLANFKPAYRVTINVQRFDSIPGDSVLVDAIWAVTKMTTRETRTGRTSASEAAEGKGFDALAAAHSRALAKVSSDIATAIRAIDAAPTESAKPSGALAPVEKRQRK